MKFAAIIEYLQESDKVNALRPVHRQYLMQLKDAVSWPRRGRSPTAAGLIIYETATREEAEQLLKGDPFSKSGVFVTYQLRPWNPVFANRELFPAT